MKTTKLTVDDQNDEIRAQVEREMSKPIGGFENARDEDEHRFRQDAVVTAAPSMESAAKIMGLKIRPGEPDNLTIAQLIRQRAELLAALEKIAVGCSPASIAIQSGGNVGKQSPNLVSLASACGEIAFTAIQSVKGGI